MENKTTTIGQVNYVLNEWQKEQLREQDTKEGRQCLLKTWEEFDSQAHQEDEIFCNSTYDGVGCWSFTPANTTLVRTCAQVFEEANDFDIEPGRIVTGIAERICTENGTWLWGNWTNYTQCAENFNDEITPTRRTIPLDTRDETVVEAVRYILFIGSILSLVLLSISLFIFLYFKSLRCDRITVHIHLMTSLCLRFILLIVITEPVIFNRRQNNYRSVDEVCKVVLSLLMYATVASINWMFIQGHYLHGRLTTVFDRGIPLKIYLAIGWGLPLILILVWATVMETYYPIPCWQNLLAERRIIWIIVGPMLFALCLNLLFLINIMRVLLTKIQRTSAITEAAQFRRAVKATLILFPLLGINNLLFIYNPGGQYENYYMLANSIFQSSQGIFVSILYCFMSSDVRDAVRREYLKFTIRRSASNAFRNSTIKRQRNKSLTTATSAMTPRSTPGSYNSGYKQERAASYKKNNGITEKEEDTVGFLQSTIVETDGMNGDRLNLESKRQHFIPFKRSECKNENTTTNSSNNGMLAVNLSPLTVTSSTTKISTEQCEADGKV